MFGVLSLLFASSSTRRLLPDQQQKKPLCLPLTMPLLSLTDCQWNRKTYRRSVNCRWTRRFSAMLVGSGAASMFLLTNMTMADWLWLADSAVRCRCHRHNFSHIGLSTEYTQLSLRHSVSHTDWVRTTTTYIGLTPLRNESRSWQQFSTAVAYRAVSHRAIGSYSRSGTIWLTVRHGMVYYSRQHKQAGTQRHSLRFWLCCAVLNRTVAP